MIFRLNDKELDYLEINSSQVKNNFICYGEKYNLQKITYKILNINKKYYTLSWRDSRSRNLFLGVNYDNVKL